MKRTYVSIMAAVVISAFLCSDAFAFGAPCPRRGGFRFHKAKRNIAAELNLTGDQQKQFEQAKADGRKAMKELYGVIREKKDALREAISKPGATRAGVEPLVADIKSLEARMTDQKVDRIFKAKAILTPEQFTKLEEMKEKRMEGRKERGKGR